jgi:ceramide glucosyltransferase
MLHNILIYLWYLSLLAAVLSIGYAVVALRRVGTFKPGADTATGFTIPVSLIKPVSGLDHGLYENLRTFCVQDYPCFQVIFTVASAADPAIPVIRRIIDDLPGHDLQLVVEPARTGRNAKVCNVANGYPRARHDLIVIADSDMRVRPDYLKCVVAPFSEPNVGAVTCLYTGTATTGLPSRLGSMSINDAFLPSVLVALSMEELTFCFGATMAIRRAALEAIGGFERLESVLADDFMLGKLVSEQGYEVRLASCLVENIVAETDLKTLLKHELRWSRTVRTVRPLGHAFSFITHPVPLCLITLGMPVQHYLGALLLASALSLRIFQHLLVHRRFQIPGQATPWLVPLREVISFGVWCASLMGNGIHWRGRDFVVERNGQLQPVEEFEP